MNLVAEVPCTWQVANGFILLAVLTNTTNRGNWGLLRINDGYSFSHGSVKNGCIRKVTCKVTTIGGAHFSVPWLLEDGRYYNNPSKTRLFLGRGEAWVTLKHPWKLLWFNEELMGPHSNGPKNLPQICWDFCCRRLVEPKKPNFQPRNIQKLRKIRARAQKPVVSKVITPLIGVIT